MLNSISNALGTPSSRLEEMAGRDRAATENAAQEFEAVFLAEMLMHAGIDEALARDSGFGGETIVSLMVAELAEEIAKKGSFGLAEKIRQGLGRNS